MGVKSKAVKAATLALAQGIRAGGRIFYDVIRHLDDKAAKVFRKHSSRIARELDSIATIPDLTVRIVREKVAYFMAGVLKVDHGTALVIADSVEGVLWLLL